MSAALRRMNCLTAANEPVWAIVSGYPAANRLERVLVILQACIDDSGSGQPPVFVLGGFVSSVERWLAFSDAWQAALDKSPALKYFKMKEAADCRGQFSGWSFSDRDKPVLDFVSIIKTHAITGIACAVILDDYKAIFSKRVSKKMDHPYLIAFYGVMLTFHRMQNYVGDDRQVDFIFDEQGKQIGQALEGWKHWKRLASPEAAKFIGNAPISKDDLKFLPLQAADLLAWRTRRQFVDKSIGSVHPIMGPSEINCMVDVWDKPRLKDMFERMSALNVKSGSAFLYDLPKSRR